MGTCLSKKKVPSSSTAPLAVSSTKPDTETEQKNPKNVVVQSKPKVGKTDSELKQRKENVNNSHNKTVQQVKEKHEPAQEEVEDKGQLKKEVVMMKHRKSYDAPKSEACGSSSMVDDKVVAAATAMGVVGVRTSNCNEEEVDAILLHCGRLSRNSSGKATSSAAGRRYSGSKRSFDFDHCENDTISNDEEQKKANANDDNDMANGEKSSRQHRQRHRRSPRPSPEGRRRRTPSRERDQQQQNCSGSSRERRVSRSPGRRTSETTIPSSNASNNNTSSRPGKMVSVPASVTSSLVMDKSNNIGGSGGGESTAAAAAGVKRITVKRNVGAASPRSQSPAKRNVGAASPRAQSPARTNGNAANAKVLLSENQQQPAAISRNNSRRAEHSPYRRNPLSELDPNSLAYPQSASNNSCCRVQNKTRKENDTEANQKQNSTSKVAFDKNMSANCKTKVQQEEDVKVQSSMADNVVVKTVVAARVDNLKPQQTLTRSRSSRRSRDLDLDPEVLLAPPQSYTSLLLEDIQNFHQTNTSSVTLPACVTKACSILEAVADLNSATAEDRRTPPSYQSSRNECNVPLSTNQYGRRVTDTKDPFVESEVVVNDDVMEPSFHKYVTVRTRGGSLCGVDMEDQESSGSNSFTGSSGQQQWGISSASWEPSSADSRDCLTSKLNCSGGASGGDGTRKNLNSKSRDCDHQHSGIGRSRIGAIKGLHNIPVVTAAAST